MASQKYSLEDIRLRLNELDDQLLQLLSERRKLSIEVVKNKVKTSKPVRDAVREQQLLTKLIHNGHEHYQLDAPILRKFFILSLKTRFYYSSLICKI